MDLESDQAYISSLEGVSRKTKGNMEPSHRKLGEKNKEGEH